MSVALTCALSSLLACAAPAAQTQPAGGQPPIAPASQEPDWVDLLQRLWGLDPDRDLRNPVTAGAPAALFVKADKDKPIVFAPIIALGMEVKTHGGWYPAGPKASEAPDDPAKRRVELWTYAFKQPQAQMDAFEFTPPPLQSGEATFDPGITPFGLWVSNESFNDGGVYSQPALVARSNERLRAQPYKAMIYPTRDRKTGKFVRDSYIIGWEYSTNDDFQDVVTRIDNVRLLPADPPLEGVLRAQTLVTKVAEGFKFVEGPAWDDATQTLYFSDIPESRIYAFSRNKSTVVNADSGQSNGLMFDKSGALVRCEHRGRRVSRGKPSEPGADIVTSYEGKRLNSPNDLWFDAQGGFYFTDPRYGDRSDMEMSKEAVYYVTADGAITRVIDDLVRPNGIALSPDGRRLYVIDHGSDSLHRYDITAPGRISAHQRIASVDHPDGMTVDADGRLYIAGYSGIWVLSPAGKWLGLIETPELPANCTFGGKDRRTLFITAQTSLYSIETQTRGWHVHRDGPPPK